MGAIMDAKYPREMFAEIHPGEALKIDAPIAAAGIFRRELVAPCSRRS